MSLNILINEVVGIIPGIGDAFSFWFKSNVRNHELLQRHLGEPGRAQHSDWVFVAAVPRNFVPGRLSGPRRQLFCSQGAGGVAESPVIGFLKRAA
jgi:hypothetical protein